MLRITVAVLMLTAFTFAYPENPPVAHTGGFGEPTCHACHFDGDLNDGLASLAIIGIDSTYMPGGQYELAVTMRRSNMAQAGFQLSIRYPGGNQAGSLSIVDDVVAIDEANNIQYIRHSPNGTVPAADDSVAWTFHWLAPDSADAVYFHLSANAANGDDSEFGDAIYQVEHLIRAIEYNE